MIDTQSPIGLKSAITNNATVQPNTELLETLRATLPQFFEKDIVDTDGNTTARGAFKTDKFLEEIKANNIAEARDGYKLGFVGKDYARLQTGRASETVIVPDCKHNALPENKDSGNVFITGDNLDALRHLVNAYENRIKLIYIDPPYNTGKEFVYSDKFEFDDEKLQSALGYTPQEVDRLKSIQGKSSHSAWLTFMYPRLKIAQKLLTPDGVIFVSIDDNEQANLKLLMDDVFGEGNFIGEIVWSKKRKGSFLSKQIISLTEYLLVFTKNKTECVGLYGGQADETESQPIIKRTNKESTLAIKAGLITTKLADGKYKKGIYGDDINPVELLDDVIFENNVNINDFRIKAPFIWSQQFLDDEVGKGTKLIINTLNFQIRVFRILDDNSFKGYGSLIDGVKIKGTNEDAYEELETLFGAEKIFDYSKPVNYIKEIITAVTFFDKDAIVLDFFAGSGTTAHAVMRLNAEDGGNRKYIMVQWDEKTYETKDGNAVLDKNGNKIPKKGSEAAYNAKYESIDQISRERIKRAGAKILKEYNEKEAANAGELQLSDKTAQPKWNKDIGFKHYRLVTPDVKTLDKIETFDPSVPALIADDMITPFSNKETNTSGIETLLTTWLIDDGFTFDTPARKLEFAGYAAHLVHSKLYLIAPDWSSLQTKELLNRIGTNTLNVQHIVVYAYSFIMESLRELEINIKNTLDGDHQVYIERRY